MFGLDTLKPGLNQNTTEGQGKRLDLHLVRILFLLHQGCRNYNIVTTTVAH